MRSDSKDGGVVIPHRVVCLQNLFTEERGSAREQPAPRLKNSASNRQAQQKSRISQIYFPIALISFCTPSHAASFRLAFPLFVK